MRAGRSPLTMRLTDKGKQLLERLSDRRGVSQTAIVEQLIRDEADRQGVAVPDAEARQAEPVAVKEAVPA